MQGILFLVETADDGTNISEITHSYRCVLIVHVSSYRLQYTCLLLVACFICLVFLVGVLIVSGFTLIVLSYDALGTRWQVPGHLRVQGSSALG